MAPLSAARAREFFTACDFAREYTGSFGFLVDMRERVIAGKPLSDNMVDAILRCKAADERRAAESKAAPATFTSTGPDLRSMPQGSTYVAVGEPTQFFRIDNITDGKWAGWVFVKRQAGDNFDRCGSQRPGSEYRGAYADLLAQAAAQPLVAMQRYGQEIGRCGNCNRTLTDEQSRQRGIGPDCWAMVGA